MHIFRLTNQLSQLENECCILKTKLNKYESIERNYNDALESINRLQETNRILETKCENMTSSSNEIKEIHKQQIRELEVRLSNSMENEKLANDEINHIKERLHEIHAKYEQEKKLNFSCKNDIKIFEEEIMHLKDQKNHLMEKYRSVQDNEVRELKHTLEIYSEKEVSSCAYLFNTYFYLINYFLHVEKL